MICDTKKVAWQDKERNHDYDDAETRKKIQIAHRDEKDADSGKKSEKCKNKDKVKRRKDPFAPMPIPYDNPEVPSLHEMERGETEDLVKHMKKISDLKMDTSKDQPWEIHPWGCFDVFVLSTFYVGVGISLLLGWGLIFVALLPATLVNYCFFKAIQPDTAELNRSSCRWKAHVFGQFVLSLFAQLLVFLQLMISILIMQIMGMIYCTVTCGWGRLMRNLNHLKPYNNGPSLYSHFGDCVAATGGQMVRQGYWEFMFSFVNMFSVNPWIKYWVTANPYLEDLGERFITQIGPSLQDVPLERVEINFQKFISWTRLDPEERDRIDNESFFCPHYPFPPRTHPRKASGGEERMEDDEGQKEFGRQYAIGMQLASSITTFVHTTHFRCPGSPVSSISSSMKLPIYRVMLWRNNPYHIYTGYVEAGVSNGEKTTGKYDMGLEHPMWLVNGHSWSSASRARTLSVGWIDDYFVRYIPQLNRLIRGNERGYVVARIAYAGEKEAAENEVERARAQERATVRKAS